MVDLAKLGERVRQDLATEIDAPAVEVVETDRYRAFVLVTSPTFEGMDESKRQSTVWGSALRALTDDEQRMIEFIFADAPSEVEIKK
jgi:hypothetical protein